MLDLHECFTCLLRPRVCLLYPPVTGVWVASTRCPSISLYLGRSVLSYTSVWVCRSVCHEQGLPQTRMHAGTLCPGGAGVRRVEEGCRCEEGGGGVQVHVRSGRCQHLPCRRILTECLPESIVRACSSGWSRSIVFHSSICMCLLCLRPCLWEERW